MGRRDIMLEKAEEVSRANSCSKDTAVKEIFMRLLMEVRKKNLSYKLDLFVFLVCREMY